MGQANESEICLHLSGNCCQVAKRLTGRRSRSTEAVSSHLSPRLILSLLISSLPCQVRQSTGGVASGGGSCRKTQPHSFAKLMAFHLGASFMQGCRHHRHRHPAHACPLLVFSSTPPRLLLVVVVKSACARQNLRVWWSLEASCKFACKWAWWPYPTATATASWRQAMTFHTSSSIIFQLQLQQQLQLLLQLRFELVAYVLLYSCKRDGDKAGKKKEKEEER